MNYLKKTVAALAIAGSVATATWAATGTASANTPLTTASRGTTTSSAAPSTQSAPGWSIYGFYVNEAVCASIGESLLINGLFGDNVDAYFCEGPSDPWILWVHHAR